MTKHLEEMPVRIRPANPRDAERLHEIAIASKGYWGYDFERVREWAATADFSEEGMRKKEFYVAEVQGRVVGWSAVIPGEETCWLNDLWIDPPWIGKRIGTRLFRHAVRVAGSWERSGWNRRRCRAAPGS